MEIQVPRPETERPASSNRSGGATWLDRPWRGSVPALYSRAAGQKGGTNP
jgi:hypothetical protein